QSLHTNSLDETYALPTKEAVTLALRTQQLIAHESGVADTIDPLAGSYYLETLTRRMEEGFERYLGEIERMGGMVEAVERGYPQREITEAAFHFQQQVEEGEKVIVGINKYATGEKTHVPTLGIDPEVERKQNARLQETRKKRDAGRWREALDALRGAANSGEELMPRFLEAARAKPKTSPPMTCSRAGRSRTSGFSRPSACSPRTPRSSRSMWSSGTPPATTPTTTPTSARRYERATTCLVSCRRTGSASAA